jgi:prepilin-type N-terminal cleavage/methylation domain-containing protein
MTTQPVRDEGGFTLVETLIAIVILAGGMMVLAGMFATGLAALTASGPEIIAHEKATDAIENVFTARDTRSVTWAQIRNVLGASGSDGGVFLDGENRMAEAGEDGLLNTADDGDVEKVVFPGPDNRMNTADDQDRFLTNYTRQIEIRDIGPNLRRLRVTIRYLVGGARRTYTLETFISSFA